MLKNLGKKRKKKKGFTLIELIVVLAVLAIIAMIAIPNFNQIRENSKGKSDANSATLIEKSVDMLIADDTIKSAMAAYVYTPNADGTAPAEPTTEPQKSIYQSIKGTKAPQSKNSAGKQNDSWSITVVADTNTSGGFKAKVQPTASK